MSWKVFVFETIYMHMMKLKLKIKSGFVHFKFTICFQFYTDIILY